jgi:hypothetical protein
MTTRTRAAEPTNVKAPAPTEGGGDQLETPRAAAAQERRAEEEPKEVRYVGDAGTREITAAQWKGAGVEDQEGVVWDASNDYTLPASDFTPDALRVLARDRGLKIK